MPAPLLGSPGTLQSLLYALDEPGQAVRALLKGNAAGAGRKAIDFLGDLIDAPLPGDWIPHVSHPEDEVSGSDLLGIETPGLGKTAADMVVGTLTDPLSLLTFGAGKGVGILGRTIAGAGKTLDPLTLAGKGADWAARKAASGADALLNASAEATTAAAGRTAVQDAYRGAKQAVKNTLGWHDLTDSQRATLDVSRAAGARAAKAGIEEAGRILQGLTTDEQVALGDAFDALAWKNGAVVGKLPGATVEDRLAALAATSPQLRVNEMKRAAAGIRQLGETQLRRGQDIGAFRAGPGADNYLMRQFEFDDRAYQPRVPKGGGPSPLKSRELETNDQLHDFLVANPDARYERNAARRLVERAERQGRLVERAHLGRDLVGAHFTLADAPDRTAANAMITDIAKTSPDFAHRLDQAFNGMAPRDWFTSSLATVNKFFKPAAVYGVVIPKVGSITRNQIGMVWQAATTPGVPISTQRHALTNFLESADDAWESVTKSRIAGGSPMTQKIKLIEEAYAKSGGDDQKVLQYLTDYARRGPDEAQLANGLSDAVLHGVTDGFVSSEEILRKLKSGGTKGWMGDLWSAPGVMFQGVEQRGRLAAFLDMRARHGAPKAAQLTKDAFLDYTITGEGNRRLRDIIPFAQFLTQSIPQQARFLSNHPAAGVALNPLLGQGNDQMPVYPWVADQTHIPLGLDTEGNPQYGVGLGLPIEVLNSIPNFSGGPSEIGRSIKRRLLASSQPLVKSATGYVTGEDPYFETPYGSYGRLPLTQSESSAGRAYHLLANTGLIQPVDTALGQLDKLVDPRHSAGAKAIDLLTGTRVVSVDPDLAEQRIVSDALRQNPDVKRYETYYQTGQNPDVDALMGRLHQAKDALKKKREAAKAAAGNVL